MVRLGTSTNGCSMTLRDAIIQGWPVNASPPRGAVKLLACRENAETEHMVRSILAAHSHLDRDTVINAMRLCCKDLAPPHYPRPFIICTLRRLGIG